MQTFIVLAALAVIVGVVVWVVFVVRKLEARKGFEREREAQFVAEMLRARPQAAKAVAAGATLVRPVADQFYGDRSGTLEDPFGHRWFIATHMRDVSS